MRISIEAWFVIGIYLFYISNSLKLLHNNQLILCMTLGKWKVICPDSQWQILRKTPYLFNPFLANSPIFCGTWSTATEANNIEAAIAIDEFVNALSPLNYFVIILFVMMCLCIPLALLTYGTGFVFLSMMLITYTTILVMLAVLYTKRTELGLSQRNYFSIAFDCIVCPPYAINLIRKITWQYKVKFNLIEFAVSKLNRDDFSKLVQGLILRLDEQLLNEDVNSVRCEKLKTYRCKLLGFQNECK